MRTVEARGLPADPLDAAAAFHATVVPQVRAAGADEALTVAFDPADYRHTGWRLAAIQSLAREAAPARVNAVASIDTAALAAALGYLARAPGVTGQYLPLDGRGAGGQGE